eukprot:6201117-Pleurochrysis_carterae.AAC.3
MAQQQALPATCAETLATVAGGVRHSSCPAPFAALAKLEPVARRTSLGGKMTRHFLSAGAIRFHIRVRHSVWGLTMASLRS